MCDLAQLILGILLREVTRAARYLGHDDNVPVLDAVVTPIEGQV